jgi:hypothetical protein
MNNARAQQELMSRCIPRDNGWPIRLGFLDVTRGYGSNDVVTYFKKQTDLSGDEKAAMAVFSAWSGKEPLDVGESGTMYKLARFYLWKMGIDREIITHGTLIKRVAEMEATQKIIHWSLKKLLTLEKGTSQWATAAILLNKRDILPEISFYLQKTYDAINHWTECRQAGKVWEGRTDPTITVQCQQYFNLLENGKIEIKPTRLGDCDLYCFFKAFGLITTAHGKRIWPQLQKHESNRIEGMESTLSQLHSEQTIYSNDHRVVQAEAMLLQFIEPRLSIECIRARFSNPDCVTKKWPLFWEFMANAPSVID